MSRSENTLTDLPNPKISESEFLADQADRAKAAAMAALSSAKVALGNSVDPRPAMRNHPLFVLGSASLAGFVAALLAIPSKKEQELRRMERIHRARNPEPPPARSVKRQRKDRWQTWFTSSPVHLDDAHPRSGSTDPSNPVDSDYDGHQSGDESSAPGGH